MFSEPQTGFRIAFNMFDTDGNQRVDKNEFLVVSTNPGMLQPNWHRSYVRCGVAGATDPSKSWVVCWICFSERMANHFAARCLI
jgi:hypothetical protein